jgi:DNA mismatch endonuclease (patch repair protein)
MDHLTKEKRSWNMSRIHAKETAPEITFRKLIHRAGFHYRLHDKTLIRFSVI